MENREIIQYEALEESLRHHRCSLVVSMRVGKTRIGLNNLYKSWFPGFRALVVAPNKPIFKSWQDEIAILKFEQYTENLKFSTYRSLYKLNPDDYDIVYLDEFQALTEKCEEFLAKFKGRIVGLTGTEPDDPESIKGQLAAKYCPKVYEYKVKEAVNDGILNDYRVFVHLLDLDERENHRVYFSNGGSKLTSEMDHYIYWCDRVDAAYGKDKLTFGIMRSKALQEFRSKVEYAKTLAGYIKHKLIIFANTKEQADELCKFSYHSDNPNSEYNLELLNSGVISKMSCVNQLNAGITIHELKACIVLHAYGNNSRLAQRIARCLSLRADEVADLHVLAYRNTVDFIQVQKALADFDQGKIQYIESSKVKQKITA